MTNVLYFPTGYVPRPFSLTEEDVTAILAFAYRVGATAERCVSDEGDISMTLERSRPAGLSVHRSDGRYVAITEAGAVRAVRRDRDSLLASLYG